MAVSVPVTTKTRCTLEFAQDIRNMSEIQLARTTHLCTTFAVKMENLTDIAERGGKKRTKRREVREKGDSPGEVLYVHQHGVLLHMQLISQQQQLHQLLI